jgi:cell division septation protein DedD
MSRTARIPLLLLLLTTTVSAQRLEQVDSLVNAGNYALARSTLLEWQRANLANPAVNAATRARALYLNARLTDDAARAHEQYLAVALSYPTAPEAPSALLRLAQGLLANNDPRRAAAYLERVVRDYPTAPDRALAYLWLSRTQRALGAVATACATLNGVLESRLASPEITAVLEEEEKNACSPTLAAMPSADTARPPAAASPPPPVRTPPVRTTPPPTETSGRPASTSDGQYAAQTGAFRNVQTAETITATLRRRGFDARLTYLENGTLALVRIGRYRTWGAANAEVRRLKDAGFPAMVVEDANRERR